MSYYYDRDYIPTPAPEPPAVIPNPTAADNGKFLGVTDGEYSIESLPKNSVVIDMSTNSLGTSTSDTRKKIKECGEANIPVILNFTTAVTIDTLEIPMYCFAYPIAYKKNLPRCFYWGAYTSDGFVVIGLTSNDGTLHIIANDTVTA